MSATPLRIDDTRILPQGEIFLLTRQGDHFHAEVYNTTGMNRCPADEFNGIDTVVLAKETGAEVVWRNPRRYWTMDAITVTLVGEPRELGGVWFNFMAKMDMPPAFDPAHSQAENAFAPMHIQRVNSYEFRAGRTVQMLRSPDDVTWVMQTFTDHIATDLAEADLPTLGARLALPEGWEYRQATLEEDLFITTTGLAAIVPDNLANMYQGCVDGVNNFDPWK